MPDMTVDLIAEESPKQGAAGDGNTTLALTTCFPLSPFGTRHLLSVVGVPDYAHCHLVLPALLPGEYCGSGRRDGTQDAK